MSLDRKKGFIINIVFAGLIAALGILVLKYLLSWLLPFIIGMIVAIIAQFPIRFLSKRFTKVNPKIIAVIITLLIVLLVIFIVGLLVNELIGFISRLPNWYSKSIPGLIEMLNEKLQSFINTFPKATREDILSFLTLLSGSIQNQLGALSSTAVKLATGIATALPSFLLVVLISIISTFYFSVDYASVTRFIRRQIPKKYRALFQDTQQKFWGTIAKMFEAYSLILFITFIELSIGLSIAGVDYAIAIAALTASVDILPILGTGTILIPWALILMITGKIPSAIVLLVTYGVILIVRNILEPRLVGSKIGLHPLVTLICMYVGLKLIGIVGIFIFPLIVILVKNAQETGFIRIWQD